MTVDAIWESIHGQLVRLPAGARLAFLKCDVPHPHEAGAYPSAAWQTGQIANFRFPPSSDRRGVHVVEFVDRWVVQLDEVHAERDPGEEVACDDPVAIRSGAAVLGATIGAAISKSVAGAVFCGAAGLLIGALLAEESCTVSTKPSRRG